jgi:hypothetical protein
MENRTLNDFERLKVVGDITNYAEVYSKFGKIIGTIQQGKYFTNRTPAHFMRKYYGFGVSLNVLHFLKKNKIREIIIKYSDSQNSPEHYLGYVADFLESELEHNFICDEKSDIQKFLSLNDLIKF